MNGFFVPLGGGDPIPLVKDTIIVGRRPDSDITLDFPNVSAQHCQLRFKRGAWIIEDLESTNGVRVNGFKVQKTRLMPGDEVTIARKHSFRIQYQLEGNGDFDEPDEEKAPTPSENVFGKSLLERAGLEKPTRSEKREPKLFRGAEDDAIDDDLDVEDEP
jgi:adenylate cyclase